MIAQPPNKAKMEELRKMEERMDDALKAQTEGSVEDAGTNTVEDNGATGDVQQDTKASSTQEVKASRTQDVKTSRTQKVKTSSSTEEIRDQNADHTVEVVEGNQGSPDKKSRVLGVGQQTRRPYNFTMYDVIMRALKIRAAKLGIQPWKLMNEILRNYLVEVGELKE